MLKKLVVAVAFVAFSTSGVALAGSLVNKDSTRHEFKMNCGAGTSTGSISGNTTQSGRVHKGCTITLSNGNSITTSNDNDVVIKGGAMSQK